MLIERIRRDYRKMRFLIKLRVMNENAVGAYVRSTLGWSLALPEKEREAIRKAAAREMKNPTDPEIALLMRAFERAREAFTIEEDVVVKRMEQNAKQLVVWDAWARDVKGFGPKGLAVIVGIAGDLNEWRSLPGLYKRLGLAPYAGRACSSWGAKELTAEEWTEAGYSPRNRSAVFAYVGEPIMRQGPYAEVYQARRIYEADRLPDGPRKKMTVHMRAHRYATKRLVKHLWQRWRANPTAYAE